MEGLATAYRGGVSATAGLMAVAERSAFSAVGGAIKGGRTVSVFRVGWRYKGHPVWLRFPEFVSNVPGSLTFSNDSSVPLSVTLGSIFQLEEPEWTGLDSSKSVRPPT